MIINKYKSQDLATLSVQDRNDYLLAIAKKDFLPIDFRFEAYEIIKHSVKNKIQVYKKSIEGEVVYEITFYKDKEKKVSIKSLQMFEKMDGLFINQWNLY